MAPSSSSSGGRVNRGPRRRERFVRFPEGVYVKRFIGKRGDNIRKVTESTETRMSFMRDRRTLHITGESEDALEEAITVVRIEVEKHGGDLAVCVSEQRTLKQNIRATFGLRPFRNRLDHIEAATRTL